MSEAVKAGRGGAEGKPLLILAISAAFFAILMAAGIISVSHLAGTASVKGLGTAKMNVQNFVAIFILATLGFLFLIYFLKVKKLKRAIFKTIFFLAVFAGTAVFFNVWVSRTIAFLAGIFTALVWWAYPKIVSQNACLAFTMLGAGIFLGYVFSPGTAAFLLLLFSFYDLIAVYVTKHMVAMAKEMVANGALPAVFIPMNLSGLREDINRIAAGGEKFLILGGGDIVFPLFFCVSVARNYGTFAAALTAIFSTIGFCASFYQFLNQGTRRPIPALPPIALFTLIGYALVIFLK